MRKIIFFVLMSFVAAKIVAQTQPEKEKTDKKSYWQLSSRLGYDFPMFKENFKYIDYKGGFMGGLSVNRYWNHVGVQADFDYIKSSPFSTLGSPLPYLGGPALAQIELATKKKDLTRMFVGIGPAYKWQSKKDRLTIELAAMGGIAIVDGAEILVEGLKNLPSVPKSVIMTYHSGFDNQKALTVKAQARATYWFKGEKWGASAGVYYINHFGVNESQKNQLLTDNGYLSSLYYSQMGTFISQGVNNGEPVYNFQFNESRNFNSDTNDQQKIKLASVGIFAGISYRFLTTPKAKKVVEEKPVEKPKPVVEEKYCMQITAKDKYTSELLPNTDVVVKNDKGETIKTGKTDSLGQAKFCDILADNYKISGLFNEIALEENSIQKSEFKSKEVLMKDVLYADRNFIIKGKAFECNTTTPIAGINVVLENNEKAFKKLTVTDAEGNFVLQLPEIGIYSLYGKKENYFSQTESITTSNYSRDKNLFVKIEICAEKADCGKGLGLKNILFDLNKYVIKDIAKIELNRLVKFMQDNPTIKVEVGSHTDCRSSTVYNQKLSQNRANASVSYVVSQGILKSRITGKGYGESKLINTCADGAKCSEDEHSLNRRTEMKVICPENK